MQYISQKLTNQLLSLNLISKSEINLYRYGIDVLLSSILNIITILGCSLFFNTIWHGVIFLIFFVPLRITLGGYHASTRLNCFLVSVLLYGLISYLQLLIYYFRLRCIFWISLLSFCTLYIFFCKPAANSHHPVKTDILNKNKRMANRILLFDFTLCLIWIISSPTHPLSQFSILSLFAVILLHAIPRR